MQSEHSTTELQPRGHNKDLDLKISHATLLQLQLENKMI